MLTSPKDVSHRFFRVCTSLCRLGSTFSSSPPKCPYCFFFNVLFTFSFLQPQMFSPNWGEMYNFDAKLLQIVHPGLPLTYYDVYNYSAFQHFAGFISATWTSLGKTLLKKIYTCDQCWFTVVCLSQVVQFGTLTNVWMFQKKISLMWF